MGLLDDAIREHLDLKRRRGADPAEVERAEREALGPVRRNREPAEVAEPDDLAAPDGFAYDQDDEQEWAHDSVHDSMHEAGAESPADHAPADRYSEPADSDFPEADFDRPEPPAVRAPLQRDPFDDAGDVAPPPREWAPEERRPAQRFRPDASPERPAGGVGDETAPYRVGEDEPEDGEDVLEETPEFLQDTPDHDRLWFEQRPPRDFDFDG